LAFLALPAVASGQLTLGAKGGIASFTVKGHPVDALR